MIDGMDRCPTHGEPFIVHPVDLRLDRDGEPSIIVDQVDVHCCPVTGCRFVRPTADAQSRLFQLLGEHPENRLKESVRVAIVDWRGR